MKVLEIKKNDLIENIEKIKKLVQERQEENRKCRIIAVVKGNGYGMGLVEYTKFLIENGIDFFAVSTFEEAIELKKAGIKQDILMLSSICIEEEVKELVKQGVILTIGSKLSGEIANCIAQEEQLAVRAHIKIDTGFGRYGFLYENILELLALIDNLTNIKIEGYFTHFSEAYAKDNKWTSLQYKRFISTIEQLKSNGVETGLLHVCNSSAFLRYDNMDLDAVRIGSAFTGRISVENTIGLKKIGQLQSKVCEIKTLPANYNIGYSNTYQTKRETKIAVVPVGYSDGFHIGVQKDTYRWNDQIRYLYHDFKSLFKKNKIYVKINGKEYPILGRVGMFHIIIDINQDNIQVNDIVYIDAKPIYISEKIRREYL